jgi:hypothetical protein
MVKSQILNLIITPSFDHNSCKSGLNEQSEGTLSIYASRLNGVLGAQYGTCLPFKQGSEHSQLSDECNS